MFMLIQSLIFQRILPVDDMKAAAFRVIMPELEVPKPSNSSLSVFTNFVNNVNFDQASATSCMV